MDPHGTFSHDDLSHTLEAGNQHGTQQNKSPLTQPPLSVRSRRACSKALNVCRFGLQLEPNRYEKQKLNLIMKEPYPTYVFVLLAKGLAPTKIKFKDRTTPQSTSSNNEH